MNAKDLTRLKKASLDIQLASDKFVRDGIFKILKEAGADDKTARDVVEEVTNCRTETTLN